MEVAGSTGSSLKWLILLIFHNVFFLKLYCKNKWDFGTFTCIFFLIFDGTIGFLDKNWSSIVKNTKKVWIWLTLLILLKVELLLMRPSRQSIQISVQFILQLFDELDGSIFITLHECLIFLLCWPAKCCLRCFWRRGILFTVSSVFLAMKPQACLNLLQSKIWLKIQRVIHKFSQRIHILSEKIKKKLPNQQNATVFWDMLLFCATAAQKVAVRQKRQVVTVYAYF